MGKENKLGLKDFIHQVTNELIEAAETAKAQNRANLGLSKVELEIATEVTMEADGSVNLAVLQIDGKTSRARTHLVRVELIPYEGEGGGPLSGIEIIPNSSDQVSTMTEGIRQQIGNRGKRVIIAPPIARNE